MAWWIPLAMMAGQMAMQRKASNDRLLMPNYSKDYDQERFSTGGGWKGKTASNIMQGSSLLSSVFGVENKKKNNIFDQLNQISDDQNIGGSFYDL
jgi:hypothetical protein